MVPSPFSLLLKGRRKEPKNEETRKMEPLQNTNVIDLCDDSSVEEENNRKMDTDKTENQGSKSPSKSTSDDDNDVLLVWSPDKKKKKAPPSSCTSTQVSTTPASISSRKRKDPQIPGAFEGTTTTADARAQESAPDRSTMTTTSSSANKRHSPDITNTPSATPSSPVLIFLEEGDNGVVTEGIFRVLQQLTHAFLTRTRPTTQIQTCCSSLPSTLQQGQRQQRSTQLTLMHIQQQDKWSCGYRNTQMLLAAVVPQLDPQQHPYFHKRPLLSSLVINLPSVFQLQTTLQEAWSAGIDPRAMEHYQNGIVGTTEKIGAVEVWSVLEYWKIDSAVVQFIRCRESRQLLGPFCQTYFGDNTMIQQHRHSCLLCSNVPVRQVVQQILQTAASNRTNLYASSSNCSCPRLPLYLQWKGHSVTVVGVECDTRNTTSSSLSPPSPTHLIVLDPAKAATSFVQQWHRGVVGTTTRIPLTRLQTLDCQVVACSTCVPPSLAQHHPYQPPILEGNSVTAAEDAVRQTLRQG